MTFRVRVYCGLAIGALVASQTGCDTAVGPSSDAAVEPVVVSEMPPGADAGGHAHASAGPHGGSIIEFGSEAYHAEFVHDDAAKTVTVYMLDSSAKVAVPVQATEVLVNLTHDGQGEQFKLPAAPESEDPAGFSSRFVSTDAKLAEAVDHTHGGATLVVTIDGKQYRGELGHEGHDH